MELPCESPGEQVMTRLDVIAVARSRGVICRLPARVRKDQSEVHQLLCGEHTWEEHLTIRDRRGIHLDVPIEKLQFSRRKLLASNHDLILVNSADPRSANIAASDVRFVRGEKPVWHHHRRHP